jgi:DNA-binding transcriptional ArsR family regulator
MAKINSQVIRFFEALADETRLKILVAISKEPRTVNDIHAVVEELTLSAVSHQLSFMANQGIIECEKKGRNKYFRLSHKFCWCILRDAFNYFDKTHTCTKCGNIEKEGGLLGKQ